MGKPLRWWVIPGAMVVLLRVVTLEGQAPDSAALRAPVPAAAPLAEVALLEAAARRIGPVALDASAAARIEVPSTWAGRRGQMTVWRRIGGAREATPWLEITPRVRDDGTIPFLGLAAGRYDFELTFVDNGSTVLLTGNDAAVPGTVVLK